MTQIAERLGETIEQSIEKRTAQQVANKRRMDHFMHSIKTVFKKTTHKMEARNP